MAKLWLELDRVDLLHEALLRFIKHYGEKFVGSFGVSMPRSAGASLLDAEFDFAGYRDRCLRDHFEAGIWTIERQKDTRDWHVHATVAMGFDFQSDFPFEAVKARNYLAVQHRVRKLWKALRDSAAETQYGVSNIIEWSPGQVQRSLVYSRPYLMPVRVGKAERLVSYMSGQPLGGEQSGWKPAPEGCGSWGGKGTRSHGSRVGTVSQ